MFVQEEKIFAGKVLRLQVCTMEGAEWLEEVPEDTTVEKLKERCLKHVRSCPPPRAEIGAKITAWERRAEPEPCGVTGTARRDGEKRQTERKAAAGGAPSDSRARFVCWRWGTSRKRGVVGGIFPFWKKRPQPPCCV